MAGHSKHKNIKHRKNAQDAKRSALFSKLAKEILTAAREGGPSVDDNAALRTAVDRALSANMKRAKIDAAIAKASGAERGDSLERCLYEGYGPGGVALLVECATDNRNRTIAEVRHAFSRYGCSIASAGSVAYLFAWEHHIVVACQTILEEFLEVAIDAGANDVVPEAEGHVRVVGDREVAEALRSKGIHPVRVTRVATPQTTVTLSDEDGRRLDVLTAALLELDDVDEVTSNRAALVGAS